MTVPDIRIRDLNSRPRRQDGEHVLYWMIANRRLQWNFALQRAVEHARELRRPLIVLEALRCGYRWASDRLHAFILQGMAEHRRRLAETNVLYHPYVEPEAGAGSGLLRALAAPACVVVTDDYPTFFLPRMLNAAADRLEVRLEAVDSCGLLPLRATDRDYPTAYSFRRFLQRELPEYLADPPSEHPLVGDALEPAKALPDGVASRWPAADSALLGGDAAALSGLPLDHDVAPVSAGGGSAAARRRLETFVDERLPRYHESRNDPARDATSGLSPYLHFGQISSHEIFAAVMEHESWSPADLGTDTRGKRTGWWGVGPGAEGFLDQLVTWRELGFNMSAHRADHDRYASLPSWAKDSLARHADDDRPHVYERAELESAETHDPIWNAAQRQLVREGSIHNYLRMLWGKKVLEWSPSPEVALTRLIHLNNKYALDGRDPNSYSGIFWCLGRYDRAWGPRRPIFGTVRYMSSKNTRRKLDLAAYLDRYGD